MRRHHPANEVGWSPDSSNNGDAGSPHGHEKRFASTAKARAAEDLRGEAQTPGITGRNGPVGGIISTLLDVPLLFLCLRTIIKTGHCYGYPLDRPTDEAWVLGALAVALSATQEKRTDLMARLQEIEELLVEEVQENIVVEETASLLTQIEILEDIPVIRAVTGGLLNLSVASSNLCDGAAPLPGALAAGQRQGRGDQAKSAPWRCSAALRVVRCLCTGQLQHPTRSEFRRGISILPGGRDLHPGHSSFDLANWGPGCGERRQRSPRWRSPPTRDRLGRDEVGFSEQSLLASINERGIATLERGRLHAMRVLRSPGR